MKKKILFNKSNREFHLIAHMKNSQLINLMWKNKKV